MTPNAAPRLEGALTDRPGTARQNTLDRLIRVLATVGGSAAALGSGAQPTGSTTADLVVLVLLGAAISHAISMGPPAMWAAIAAIAVLTTGLAGVTGQLTVAGGAVHGWRRSGPLPAMSENRTDLDSLVAALVGIGASAALFRLQNVFVNRSSAALVAVVVACVFAVTFTRFTRKQRRIVASGLFVCTLAAIGVSVAAATSIVGLRAEVAEASASAREAAELLRSGQSEAALATLNEAQIELTSIDDRLQNGWPRLATAVPVVGQNIQALQAGSTSAARLVSAAQDLGRSASIDELFRNGTVDLAQLEELRSSLTDIEAVLDQSGGDLEAVQNPWLVPVVRNEVAELGDELEGFRNTLGKVGRLAEILPALLGADSPRNYLVLIANPSEARELGGFAGGYAVVSIDSGRIVVTRSGRTPELNHTPTTHDALTRTYPQRFLEHKPWLYGQNYTAMADLGTLTQAIAELFPSMGGTPIDGLLYLDPHALEALVALTGNVELPQHGLTLTATNTAQFFHIDQYELIPSQSVRTKVLDDLILVFFKRFSGDVSIETSQVGRMATTIQQGRLGFATTDRAELDVLSEIGLARRFGHDQIGDFLSVSHLNAGPNKLDAYLERDIRYEVAVDPESGSLTANLLVTLTNTAPKGLSSYVNGNRRGLPAGTNRATLVIHTPHELVSRSASTEPAFDRTFQEFGLWRYEQLVVLATGESETIRFELRGNVGHDNRYELEVAHQPLVTTDDLVVTVSHNARTLAPLAVLSSELRTNTTFEVQLE